MPTEKTKYLRVFQADGSVWDIPLEVIARNRAVHYAYDFEGDVELSLTEDTYPLFNEDSFEATDWAANNMNWSDVVHAAVRVELPPPKIDWQLGWMNGKKQVIEK